MKPLSASTSAAEDRKTRSGIVLQTSTLSTNNLKSNPSAAIENN